MARLSIDSTAEHPKVEARTIKEINRSGAITIKGSIAETDSRSIHTVRLGRSIKSGRSSPEPSEDLGLMEEVSHDLTQANLSTKDAKRTKGSTRKGYRKWHRAADFPNPPVGAPRPILSPGVGGEDDAAEWEVDCILDSRPSISKKGEVWYCVRWTGWPDVTWEPQDALKNGMESVREFHRSNPGKPKPINWQADVQFH